VGADVQHEGGAGGRDERDAEREHGLLDRDPDSGVQRLLRLGAEAGVLVSLTAEGHDDADDRQLFVDDVHRVAFEAPDVDQPRLDVLPIERRGVVHEWDDNSRRDRELRLEPVGDEEHPQERDQRLGHRQQGGRDRSGLMGDVVHLVDEPTCSTLIVILE
jgi:hypothetical protein